MLIRSPTGAMRFSRRYGQFIADRLNEASAILSSPWSRLSLRKRATEVIDQHGYSPAFCDALAAVEAMPKGCV